MKVLGGNFVRTFHIKWVDWTIPIRISVNRNLSIDSNEAQAKIVDQMNAWDNEDCGTKPRNAEPQGQKCLYHVSW